MHASEVTPEIAAQANELYWGSSASVNRIAEELDLSKGALYSTIEPLVSGLGCPLCGDQVGYPNRTARDKEQLDCPTCDWDGAPDETMSWTEEEEEDPEAPDGETIAAPPESRGLAVSLTTQSDPEEADARRRDASLLHTIAKGAMIGGTVGLALVIWARRR